MKKVNFKKLDQVKKILISSLRLLKIVWKIDRKLFMGSVIAILIPGVIPFVNIYIYKLVIDLVVQVVGGATFNPAQFYPLIALRIFTYFIQDAAFRTQALMQNLLWTKVPIELNQILLGKISTLDIQYFENDKFRNLLEKVRESYQFRPQRLIQSIFFALQSLIQVSIAFVTLVHLNWFFVILILVVAIPEFINQTIQSKMAYTIWDAESSLKKRYGYLNHLLQHQKEVKEVKMFGLGSKFLLELRNLQQTFYNNNIKVAKRGYFTGLGFNALSTVSFIGIELYVIYEALAKRVTIGDIAFYTGVVNNFQNGLGGLLSNVNEILDNGMYIQTIFEVLDTQPIVKKQLNGTKLKLQKAPTIEFKNATFSYPESKNKILDNFSLKIEPGQKIAFVGENGSGKSTIIKLLARFYDVNRGQILINGTDIKSLDLDSWYKNLGVLFQDFNKYEDSAGDNIYFGKIYEPKELEKIIQASVSAGSHQMIKKYEKGYSQMLGKMFEEGLELSGGQWQKIALARAFFKNAPVLVLDEPTSSIDAKAESEIFERVEKLSKDKTVIIISHRFSTVRNADKIYVIENGKISEDGNHKELLKKQGIYSKLFHLQARGYQ